MRGQLKNEEVARNQARSKCDLQEWPSSALNLKPALFCESHKPDEIIWFQQKACRNPLVICGCSLWSHLPPLPSFLSTPQSDFNSTRNHTQSYWKGKLGSFLRSPQAYLSSSLKKTFRHFDCVRSCLLCVSSGMCMPGRAGSNKRTNGVNFLLLPHGSWNWTQVLCLGIKSFYRLGHLAGFSSFSFSSSSSSFPFPSSPFWDMGLM